MRHACQRGDPLKWAPSARTKNGGDADEQHQNLLQDQEHDDALRLPLRDLAMSDLQGQRHVSLPRLLSSEEEVEEQARVQVTMRKLAKNSNGQCP